MEFDVTIVVVVHPKAQNTLQKNNRFMVRTIALWSFTPGFIIQGIECSVVERW